MYPFSSNVQRGIIYLLKNDHDFFTQISPLVRSDYFEYPTHAKIYDAVLSHYNEYLMIPTDDFIVEGIRKELGENGKISDYVDELEDINAIDPESVEDKEFVLDLVEESKVILDAASLCKNSVAAALLALVAAAHAKQHGRHRCDYRRDDAGDHAHQPLEALARPLHNGEKARQLEHDDGGNRAADDNKVYSNAVEAVHAVFRLESLQRTCRAPEPVEMRFKPVVPLPFVRVIILFGSHPVAACSSPLALSWAPLAA